MSKRVFISKDASETLELQSFLEEKDIKLISNSFLDYQEVKFDIQKEYDVIFFGSPRAVKFFLGKAKVPEKAKLACVGATTSSELKKAGYPSDFIGTTSDINSLAKEFRNWCSKDDVVLFPISSKSLQSISSHFDEKNKIETVIYDTIITGKTIDTCDIYVFTSPSNLDGFLMDNVLRKSDIVIVWGTSTAKAAAAKNIMANYTLEAPTIKSLIDLLTTLT